MEYIVYRFVPFSSEDSILCTLLSTETHNQYYSKTGSLLFQHKTQSTNFFEVYKLVYLYLDSHNIFFQLTSQTSNCLRFFLDVYFFRHLLNKILDIKSLVVADGISIIFDPCFSHCYCCYVENDPIRSGLLHFILCI